MSLSTLYNRVKSQLRQIYNTRNRAYNRRRWHHNYDRALRRRSPAIRFSNNRSNYKYKFGRKKKQKRYKRAQVSRKIKQYVNYQLNRNTESKYIAIDFDQDTMINGTPEPTSQTVFRKSLARLATDSGQSLQIPRITPAELPETNGKRMGNKIILKNIQIRTEMTSTKQQNYCKWFFYLIKTYDNTAPDVRNLQPHNFLQNHNVWKKENNPQKGVKVIWSKSVRQNNLPVVGTQLLGTGDDAVVAKSMTQRITRRVFNVKLNTMIQTNDNNSQQNCNLWLVRFAEYENVVPITQGIDSFPSCEIRSYLFYRDA